jgi:hypothetical protein
MSKARTAGDNLNVALAQHGQPALQLDAGKETGAISRVAKVR